MGEDWRRGRLYLPRRLLERHGVAEDVLTAVAAGTVAPPGYRAVLEELMAEADRYYDRAFEALPVLPPAFRRAVAVAARVYQGIHGEVRKGGYSGARRSWTSPLRKLVLGARGLRDLARASRDPNTSRLRRSLRPGMAP